MSRTAKTVIRLAGLGLIILGFTGALPQGWSIGAIAAGFVGLIAGGGGG